jgi:hypothetical protein
LPDRRLDLADKFAALAYQAILVPDRPLTSSRAQP